MGIRIRNCLGTISVRVPDYLHKRLRLLSKREHASINQLITLAIAEKISALDTEDYLEQRADRASREKFDRVLSKVAEVEPEEYVEIK